MGEVVVTTETLAEQAYVLAMNQSLRPQDRSAVFAVVSKYEELRAARVQLTAPEKVGVEAHVLRELVNDLRDLAVQYHAHQSLRGRISRLVQEVLTVRRSKDT